MPKTCKADGCRYNVFGGGYCKSHQRLRTDKKPVRPKFRTTKRAAQEAQYSIDRKIYLEKPENHFCAVFPWLEATQIHHRAGREGEMLLDQQWWLAVSDPGHKYIEANMEEAYAKSWSVSRIK